MTIVDSDFYLQASGIADTAEYENPANLITFGNSVRVVSGLFAPALGSGGFLHNSISLTNDVAAELITAGPTLGDRCGLIFCDLLGNGFAAMVKDTQFRVHPLTAFVVGNNLTFATVAAAANGDRYRAQIVGTTMTLLRNEVVVSTYAVPAAQRYAGLIMNYDNSGNLRASAFGIDGIDVGAVLATISDINGDEVLELGSTGSMTVSGFLSPVTDLEVGGLAMQSVTNTTGNDYTFVDPGFIDGDVDPGFGTLSAIASNYTETSATFSVARTLSASLTAVVMGALSDDPSSIGNAAADRGLTISSSDTLYNASGLTVYEDSTISDANDGTHNIWHRDADTDVMTLIILEIVGGIIQGITARALTASNLTLRNLTARSLT